MHRTKKEDESFPDFWIALSWAHDSFVYMALAGSPREERKAIYVKTQQWVSES